MESLRGGKAKRRCCECLDAMLDRTNLENISTCSILVGRDGEIESTCVIIAKSCHSAKNIQFEMEVRLDGAVVINRTEVTAGGCSNGWADGTSPDGKCSYCFFFLTEECPFLGAVLGISVSFIVVDSACFSLSDFALFFFLRLDRARRLASSSSAFALISSFCAESRAMAPSTSAPSSRNMFMSAEASLQYRKSWSKWSITGALKGK